MGFFVTSSGLGYVFAQMGLIPQRYHPLNLGIFNLKCWGFPYFYDLEKTNSERLLFEDQITFNQ